jgi:hypothetical protein
MRNEAMNAIGIPHGNVWIRTTKKTFCTYSFLTTFGYVQSTGIILRSEQCNQELVERRRYQKADWTLLIFWSLFRLAQTEAGYLFVHYHFPNSEFEATTQEMIATS